MTNDSPHRGFSLPEMRALWRSSYAIIRGLSTLAHSPKVSNTRGLLLVYAEPGFSLNETTFSNWYSNEHVPARLAAPGIHSAITYKSYDLQSPKWLTLYDLNSLEFLQPSALNSDSEGERRTPSHADIYQQRLYKQVSHWTPERVGRPRPTNPTKFILTVSVNIGESGEAELHKFYEEEHMLMASRIPGWIQGRRFELIDSVELGRNSNATNVGGNNVSYGHDFGWESSIARPSLKVMKYLSVHEFDGPGFWGSKEVKEMNRTPWIQRISAMLTGLEARVYEVHKAFKKDSK